MMPQWKNKIRQRLAGLRLSPTREAAIVEELAQHLDDCYAESLGNGLTEDEAYRSTLAELNGSELLALELRRVERQVAPEPIMLGTNRRRSMTADLWQDLRFGARMLAKQPGFTLIAVLTLALGIGANTAIFSLVNAVLLRSLPFPQPERIMTIWEEASADGIARQSFAPGNYADLKAQQTAFAQMAALARSEMNLTGDGEPEKWDGVAVLEPEAFDILGVKPAVGRLFLPGEYVRGANKVILISHGIWQQRFGGAADVAGKELTLNDEKFVIVGVLPANFQFLNPTASFWTPAGFSQRVAAYRYGHNLRVIARLKPGGSEAQAQAEAKTIMRRIAQEHPTEAGRLSAVVQPLHEYLIGDVRQPLLVLLVAVGFVLLIACANLASLLLARAVTRRKEVAVRIALGAGRSRIVRQLLTESALLASTGGLCGLLVAEWSFALLRQLIPSGLTDAATLGLDGQVLGYALGLSLLTAVLFGLAPAWQATRVDVNEALKQSGARSGAGHHRLQHALVVAEVALALVLTVGAGLLIQTFYRLRQIDVGFRVENTLTMQTRLPLSRYPEHAQRTDFYQRTLERVRALPGVVSTAYASRQPLTSLRGIYSLTIEGRSAQGGGAAMEADHRQISPDYFATLGIPLRQGRVFDERDMLQTAPVAIINEAMARRFWPDENPLGKGFAVDEDGRPAAHSLTIVGVVGDVKHRGLENDVWPEFYLPQPQVDYNRYSIPSDLVVRTAGDPMSLAASVRSAIHSVDPDLPVADVRTIESRLDEMVVQRRMRMTLLTAYAGLALLLAAVGIYGALAHFVTQRTSEIGIRVALGAQSGDMLRFVLRRGMGLALAGVGIGLITSFTVTRLMKALLFSVSATDPLTFGLTAIVLTLVALLACWIPARRATKVDPMVALRTE